MLGGSVRWRNWVELQTGEHIAANRNHRKVSTKPHVKRAKTSAKRWWATCAIIVQVELCGFLLVTAGEENYLYMSLNFLWCTLPTRAYTTELPGLSTARVVRAEALPNGLLNSFHVAAVSSVDCHRTAPSFSQEASHPVDVLTKVQQEPTPATWQKEHSAAFHQNAVDGAVCLLNSTETCQADAA